jgi:hypothetical protein
MMRGPEPPKLPVAELLTRLRIALADRYTVERELGAGGMAMVYLARDGTCGEPGLASSAGSRMANTSAKRVVMAAAKEG